MPTRRTLRTEALIALNALALVVGAPALAQDRKPAPRPAIAVDGHVAPPRVISPLPNPSALRQQTTIRYEDLDLATAAGARTMYGRIERSATLVCTTPEERSGAASVDRDAVERCRRASITEALVHLNNAYVTAAAQEGADSRLAAR